MNSHEHSHTHHHGAQHAGTHHRTHHSAFLQHVSPYWMIVAVVGFILSTGILFWYSWALETVQAVNVQSYIQRKARQPLLERQGAALFRSVPSAYTDRGTNVEY